MKKYILLGICLLLACSSLYASNKSMKDTVTFVPDTVRDDADLREDSLLRVLYPPVYLHTQEVRQPHSRLPRTLTSVMSGSRRIPINITPNKSYAAGEIPIQSSTTPSGARTYNVPIEVCPGMNGHTPELSLAYSSQSGSGTVGVGWAVSGLSSIMRINKSVYYDGSAGAVHLSADDAFALDGTRLVNLGSGVYETETGMIKVCARYSGSSVSCFDVYYPDGRTAVFGEAGNTSDKVCYPMTSLSDTDGNTITYTYSESDNFPRVTAITYNGASVDFSYSSGRPDYTEFYIAGMKVKDEFLLNEITVKLGETTLGTYSLQYETDNGNSLLSQIAYTAGSDTYNPLTFYYGTHKNTSMLYSSETALSRYYTSPDGGTLRTLFSGINYFGCEETVLVFPDKNPYWYFHRTGSIGRHSANSFQNKYSANDTILVYQGIGEDFAFSSVIVTEDGFIDILSTDLCGQQEEKLVKINNYVSENFDHLVFKVYQSSPTSGLSTDYIRTYDFNTVYKDARGTKSIQAKRYFAGDFTGNGKMEVLAVCADNPLGNTNQPSRCYLFDLEGNSKIYDGAPFTYHEEFVGNDNTDPQAVENGSDKLFILDYDGDGKSDSCHINADGMYIYTFSGSGSSVTVSLAASSTSLTRTSLANMTVSPCELNGDGKSDLLVRSATTSSSTSWTAYVSRGDGTFESRFFTTPVSGSGYNSSAYILQDINGDGKTDIIRYTDYDIYAYIIKNCKVSSTASSYLYRGRPDIVQADINSHNQFVRLICLTGSKALKYAYSIDEGKDFLLTRMANSLGGVERNSYSFVDNTADDGVYSRGQGAVFPYVNIKERIPVVFATEHFLGGNSSDVERFTYHNAVIHRQGLGFRGFEKFGSYSYESMSDLEADLGDNFPDNAGRKTLSTFNPYNFSVPVSTETDSETSDYTYDVTTSNTKITKILLRKVESHNLLTGVGCTTDYTYDGYGYTTYETKNYTDGTYDRMNYEYEHSPWGGNIYMLGLPTNKHRWLSAGIGSLTDDFRVTSVINHRPAATVRKINGNQVEAHSLSYDSHGNPTQDVLQRYGGTPQVTQREYDAYGRLTRETDAMGLSKEYAYDGYGRVSSSTDKYGNATTYAYDGFGRVTSAHLPDGTYEYTEYTWDDGGRNGIFAVTKSATAKPETKTVYDAIGREVRKGSKHIDGQWYYTDRLYDEYGRVSQESLPYSDTALWNTYTYDSYGRILSLTEASGRNTAYSYGNGENTVTVTGNGITVTKEYDDLGRLLSVTDPAGTTTYELNSYGLPESITAPGNVTTSFIYDGYCRKTQVDDPSAGTIRYWYDSAGNVSKTKDARNNETTFEYDSFGRMTGKACPEFTAAYTYDSYNNLASIVSDNSTSKTFTYDALGRLSQTKEYADESVWLQKDYYYSQGNLSAVKHTTQDGKITYEPYSYTNGYRTSGFAYSLQEDNAFGQPTKIVTGPLTRYNTYSEYGVLTGVRATNISPSPNTVQDMALDFDTETGNLESRTDNMRSITEQFEYDGMNRLVSYGGTTVDYDIKGNITEKSDVGTYYYGSPKPYAVTGIEPSASIPYDGQQIAYTSFYRPSCISQNGYEATFVYNEAGERVKMTVTHNDSIIYTKYYLGGNYEYIVTPISANGRLYMGGDYYHAHYVIQYGTDNAGYYILRDHLGSITHVYNGSILLQELSYDAWGRMRSPSTHELYSESDMPDLVIDRGYTGHEYLPWFGLVNMNARLYDPVLGRFLSPDPYVQSPESSQNYNRYSYCMNNPLVYKDENGCLIVNIVFHAITETLNGFRKHGFNVSKYNYKKTVNAAKIEWGMYSGGLGQMINKNTWGRLNSLYGNIVSNFFNDLGLVDHVSFLDGAVAVSGVLQDRDNAFTIGQYIIGPPRFKADWHDELFVHEYGHYRQALLLGPLYLKIVAIPSVLGSQFGVGGMDSLHRWFEIDASKRGLNHFDKKYGSQAKGYSKGNKDFFDKDSYVSGQQSPYLNPRTGKYDNAPNPINNQRNSGADYIIPILCLTLFGLF